MHSVTVAVIPSKAVGKKYDALRRIPGRKALRTFILDIQTDER
jgi:hypothetical protein